MMQPCQGMLQACFAIADQAIVLSDWLPRDATPAGENTEAPTKRNNFLAL